MALASASISVLAGLAAAASAHAQEAQPTSNAASGTPASVGEVVVTGSRIAKRDFSSNSPIVTVNAASFQNTSNVSVESTLNKLPEFTPDQDLQGVNAGDIQPTAIHTPGIATASLRGLGSNRNLVLVDGRRLTPVNGLNVIDLNTIPSAMIDHVESITGGASAVYGADAMSGVVNFILKKNFQGMDIDAQYGIAQHGGDDREFKVSAILGANFADDKGNVTFGVEHYTRSPTYQANRDFYTKGWADATTGTNALFQFAGAYYSPSAVTGGCATSAAYTSEFGAAPAGESLFFGDSDGLCALGGAWAAPVYFNSDGSLWSPGGPAFGYGAWASADYKGTIDGTTVARQTEADYSNWYFGNAFGLGSASPSPTTVSTLKENTTQYYVLSPLSRWTMYGNAHYDITDNTSAFITGNFASTESFTKQLPATLINGWGALIPYDEATDDPNSPTYDPTVGHPVPASLATLLNARQGPYPTALGTSAYDTPWLLNYVPDPNNSWLPSRTTDTRNTNWQITGGVDGKLPFGDWTYEAYGSHGETSLYSASSGNVDLDRYRAIVDSPDWGKGFNYTGNQGSSTADPTGGGFGAGHATCTSGLYNAIFFNERPSQDCLDAILVNLQSMTIVRQDVVEFDTQGTLLNLPAGPMKGSMGADYRRNSLKFVPDTLQDENNFADQVAGLYPAAYVNASVATTEGYGELDIPIIKDAPFIQSLSLNPGARYSTYTNSKSGWTYKLLGDWTVNNWIRLRGGYNLAVRAPTVAESYLGTQEVFGAGSSYGDPCSNDTSNNNPYGANAAKNTGGAKAAKSAMAICEAQMGAAGAATYYATGASHTDSGSAFGWQDQIGNPNLNPEKAHTWTAGVVLRSPVQNPWLQRTQLSVDWYKIKITGAIGFQSPDVVNQACYSQNVLDSNGDVDATLLAEAIASQACQRSSRNTSTGASNLTTVEYVNLGKIETSGFDVQLNWGVAFDAVGVNAIPGSVNVSVLFNYLSHLVTNSGAAGAWDIDWAGTEGPSSSLGVDAGSAYRWKLNTTLTYAVGPASLSLNWRHLPSAAAVGSINASATHANSPTGYAQATNTTLPVSAYNVFDLSATYNLTKTVTLRAGIDNLFDVDPPTTAATEVLAADYANAIYPSVASSGAGTTSANMYDTIGRRFYVGVNARF